VSVRRGCGAGGCNLAGQAGARIATAGWPWVLASAESESALPTRLCLGVRRSVAASYSTVHIQSAAQVADIAAAAVGTKRPLEVR